MMTAEKSRNEECIEIKSFWSDPNVVLGRIPNQIDKIKSTHLNLQTTEDKHFLMR